VATRQRRAGIDRAKPAMSNRAAKNRGVPDIGAVQVVDIAAAAAQKARIFDAGDRISDIGVALDVGHDIAVAKQSRVGRRQANVTVFRKGLACLFLTFISVPLLFSSSKPDGIRWQ